MRLIWSENKIVGCKGESTNMMCDSIAFLIFATIIISGFWILSWAAEKHHAVKGKPLTHEETNIIQIIYLVIFLVAVISAIVCFRKFWVLGLIPGAVAAFLVLPLYLAFKRKLVW
jgi:hypothetical protein